MMRRDGVCVWRRKGVLGDVHCKIPGKPGTNRPISLWLPTYGSVNPLLRRAPLLSVAPSFLKTTFTFNPFSALERASLLTSIYDSFLFDVYSWSVI